MRSGIDIRWWVAAAALVMMLHVAGMAEAAKHPAKSGAQKADANARKAAAAAQTQINAANAQAAAAQGQAAKAKHSMAEMIKAQKDAKEEYEKAQAALRKLEQDIEEAQPSSSAFGKVRDAYHASEKKYQAAMDAVKRSDEYKQKLQDAKSADSAMALTAVRKEMMDNNPAVQEPLAVLKESKAKYEPMRTTLFAEDSKWKSAKEDLDAKKQLLEDKTHELNEIQGQERAAVAGAKKAAMAAAAERNAAAMRAAQAQAAAQAKKGGGGKKHHR